jgi:hypothetical protein
MQWKLPKNPNAMPAKIHSKIVELILKVSVM